ncbi:hypothetical protein F4814DRAFT_114799 [Daldinia grandis]|nr:hypothetical protein F4814DRAFT_114799 [Daldinia grandis]
MWLGYLSYCLIIFQVQPVPAILDSVVLLCPATVVLVHLTNPATFPNNDHGVVARTENLYPRGSTMQEGSVPQACPELEIIWFGNAYWDAT